MRAAAVAAGVLVAVLVHVTLAPGLEVLGAAPDLALVAVAAIAWTGGPRTGLLAAAGAGILLDLSWPGPLGIHAIALLASAYLVSLVAERLQEGRLLVPAATGAGAGLVYGLLVIGGSETLGQSLPAAAVARQLLLGGALYDALLLPVALLLVAWLERRLPRPRAESW